MDLRSKSPPSFPRWVSWCGWRRRVMQARWCPAVASPLPDGRCRRRSGVLLGVFAMVFHDYQTHSFLPQGLVCLEAGLLQATARRAGELVAAASRVRDRFGCRRIGAGNAGGTDRSGHAGNSLREFRSSARDGVAYRSSAGKRGVERVVFSGEKVTVRTLGPGLRATRASLWKRGRCTIYHPRRRAALCRRYRDARRSKKASACRRPPCAGGLRPARSGPGRNRRSLHRLPGELQRRRHRAAPPNLRHADSSTASPSRPTSFSSCSISISRRSTRHLPPETARHGE